MDTRRKIQFYINPKSSPGEEFADAFTESTQQGERGRLWKAAMLSGFALQRVDPRLPFLLSELLSEKTTAEEVLQVIRAVSPKGISSEPGSASAQGAESECSQEQHDAADETRNNAKQMFGSD
ncbi:plasmid partitioning/stability family protein [Erwiniaceae bacterium L1_54_6]|nr:plasmid partitioning/stability family protein [Erwiniaceae bacterium L1_54_6]